MSDPALHGLTVRGLERQTPGAVVITLEVPGESREAFRYRPGQYLMVRFAGADGAEDFRSYSICQAPPVDGSAPNSVRIAVKLLGPGGFAEFAHRRLAVGDVLYALPPAGRFRLRPAPSHLAVAAGSGITPVLAMAEAALAGGERFALLFGNRTRRDVMFASQLEELERRHGSLFNVLHVFSREPSPDPLLHGRIDAGRLARLMTAVGMDDPDEARQHYLCGPAGLVSAARTHLTTTGVDRRRVHAELFATTLTP
jgi:ring-1,2-phenylacetyl-CoA epoxidase subunit PaaE